MVWSWGPGGLLHFRSVGPDSKAISPGIRPCASVTWSASKPLAYIMTSDTDQDGPSRSQSPEESGDQDNETLVEAHGMDDKSGEQSQGASEQKKIPSGAKDPLRPRRKKARRACYACQRAHLTCGKSTSLAFLSCVFVAEEV